MIGPNASYHGGVGLAHSIEEENTFSDSCHKRALLLELPEVTLGSFIISLLNMDAYFKHLERKGTMKGT